MKLLTTTALCLALAAPFLCAQSQATPTPDDGKPHKFSLHDSQFFIDDQPTRIVAGEMHPGRILPEFWDDRIKKAKAMGLNTVSVYLFWNQIEPTEGNFVFKGQSDIRRFIQLCQANGMWVSVRAGPYVCAEIEFGGFPAWLLKHPGLKVRTDEPQYMAYCKTYLEKLHEQIGDLQVTHGGPIVMVQVENELHRIDKYLTDLTKDFVDAGFDCQLSTCDPSGSPSFAPWTTIQGLPNVLRGYNGFDDDASFQTRYNQSVAVDKPMGYPIYSPEVYTGWFNVFGNWGPAKSPKVSVAQQVKKTQFLVDHKDVSWCFYLFNGGTNFGFTSGSNGNHPMQTSYDYDAPVDELGRVTPKYKALRDVLAKGLNLNLGAIPADPKVIEIPSFQLGSPLALLDRLPKDSIDSENVQSMEDIGQNVGFILYHKHMDAGLKGTLDLGAPRDYVSVMVDGAVVGEGFNGFGGRGGGATVSVAVDHSAACDLDILVHNLGRGSLITTEAGQRRGLMGNPKLDGKELTGWKIYSLPLDDPSSLPPGTDIKQATPSGPTFFSGTFDLSELGETYLDMSNWHFGVVWVNGHNLGRYWDVGSTRCLYLPSPWQKQGENQITVLELGRPPSSPEIKGVANMIETPAIRVTPLWGPPATRPAAAGN